MPTRPNEVTDIVLDHDTFAARANTMLALVEQLRAETGLPEALRVAIERFVDDEPHPELARFSETILLARRQALLQQQLDDDRRELHSGLLSHEMRVSTGHHYEMLRREACEYNHLLRSLIESCGQYFSHEELVGWLVASSQGRQDWVHGEVVGSISEIALHAALQGLPELKGLRYASVDEDLSGFDFTATWQGKMVTVDAKTGFYQPLSELKHGHRHLEISVPHEAVHGFRVTRRGLDILRHEVRQALHRSAAVDVHGPHMPADFIQA